jgi:hypothetical protein
MSLGPAPRDARGLYLDLMKRSLMNWIYADRETGLLSGMDMDTAARIEGREWPGFAHTMIGWHRLNNIQHCVETALQEGVPGDLLEAGIWRGGAAVFMRAILQAYQAADRCVWAVDSFEGVPPPDPARYPRDAGMFLHKLRQLAVGMPEVESNFERYGLLDSQVRLLKGWFRSVLPGAAIPALAVLRLDGDLYESTMDALTNLYPKLSPGGFAIIDDYNAILACREAVTDYRAAHRIEEPITAVDWSGVYWRRRLL